MIFNFLSVIIYLSFSGSGVYFHFCHCTYNNQQRWIILKTEILSLKLTFLFSLNFFLKQRLFSFNYKF